MPGRPLMEVVISEADIRFHSYPFPPASVHPAGVLGPAAIRAVDSKGLPPQIRTVGGEIVFVPAGQAEALARFAHGHGIPDVREPDVWTDLLEPFLDTVHDEDWLRVTRNRLLAAGFTEDEIERIRARVAPLVEAYNSLVWEWVELGLYDLLNAAFGPLVPRAVRRALGDPAAFYAWAMRIAARR